MHADTEDKSVISLDLPSLAKFLTKTGQNCKILLEGNVVAVNSWGFWLFPFFNQVQVSPAYAHANMYTHIGAVLV